MKRCHQMKITKTIIALCLLNFGAFMIIGESLGGDAANGKVIDGHCFLGNHGRFTEVSYEVYRYSMWHARSLWLTHPLMLICMGIYALMAKEEKERQASKSPAE
jgi:hypothetical protein